MMRSGMRGRWQPSGWLSWRVGSSAAIWTQRGSRMDDGRAGTRPPMVTGRENSVIITARACPVPPRPIGAASKPAAWIERAAGQRRAGARDARGQRGGVVNRPLVGLLREALDAL